MKTEKQIREQIENHKRLLNSFKKEHLVYYEAERAKYCRIQGQLAMLNWMLKDGGNI